MTPQLLHAEVDYFQVAIIVLAVVFSFVKWLWEQWTGNKTTMSDYDEQPESSTASSKPPPLPASPPPVAAAPWEELRKAWREVREAAQAQKQAQPPPIPAASRRQPASRKPVEAPAPVLAAPVAAPSSPPAVVQTAAPSVMLASLRSLRHDPAAMRRAIVLSEVLGPPKALS